MTSLLSIKDFGAIGAGVSSASADAAAFARLEDIKPPMLLIADGEFHIDPVTFDWPIQIILSPSATVVQRQTGVSGAAGAVTRQALFSFVSGSEGSTLTGRGWFDGRRGELTGFIDEQRTKWGAVDVLTENVVIDGPRAKNFNTFAFCIEASGATARDLHVEDSGQGIFAGKYVAGPDASTDCYGQRLRGLSAHNIDNDGADLYQHAIDIMFCHDAEISGILISGQGGDTGGNSAYASGLTVVRCMRTRISGVTHSGFTTESLKHLGISFVGNSDCLFDGLRVRDFAGVGIEDNSNYNCVIGTHAVDGCYRSTTAWPDPSTSVGYVWNCGAQYRAFNRARRQSLNGTRGTTASGRVERCGTGYHLRAPAAILENLTAAGNLGHGFYVERWAGDNGFGDPAGSLPVRGEMRNCTAVRNGKAGVSLREFDEFIIDGGACHNNGQDPAASDNDRSGINVIAAEASGRFVVKNVDCSEDQEGAIPGATTFRPGATDADNRFTVTLLAPWAVGIGQRITVKDGGGTGTDIVAKIVDLDNDEATLETASAETFSSTGNTTGLAGTWSTDGSDDTILNGSGGATLSEIDGALWLTDGSEWRQVYKIDGDNTLYLDAPFATPLSGATLSALHCDLEGIASQKYGLRINAVNIDTIFTHGNRSRGHETDWLINDFTKMEVGSEYGYVTEIALSGVPGTQTLIDDIPPGHLVRTIAAAVTETLSGGGVTSWALTVRKASDNGFLETIAGALGLGAGAKVVDTIFAQRRNDSVVRRISAAFSGGTPTSGQIKVSVRTEVEAEGLE